MKEPPKEMKFLQANFTRNLINNVRKVKTPLRDTEVDLDQQKDTSCS